MSVPEPASPEFDKNQDDADLPGQALFIDWSDVDADLNPDDDDGAAEDVTEDASQPQPQPPALVAWDPPARSDVRKMRVADLRREMELAQGAGKLPRSLVASKLKKSELREHLFPLAADDPPAAIPAKASRRAPRERLTADDGEFIRPDDGDLGTMNANASASRKRKRGDAVDGDEPPDKRTRPSSEDVNNAIYRLAELGVTAQHTVANVTRYGVNKWALTKGYTHGMRDLTPGYERNKAVLTEATATLLRQHFGDLQHLSPWAMLALINANIAMQSVGPITEIDGLIPADARAKQQATPFQKTGGDVAQKESSVSSTVGASSTVGLTASSAKTVTKSGFVSGVFS